MKNFAMVIGLFVSMAPAFAFAGECDQYPFGSSAWWQCMSGNGSSVASVKDSTNCADLINSPKDFWACIDRSRAMVNASESCADLISNPAAFWECMGHQGQ